MVGPVGAGGVSRDVRPCLALYSTNLPRDLVTPEVIAELVPEMRYA